VSNIILITVFDRRRRDPLWRITEKLSGEDKITKKAVSLFYEQIDDIIKKRLNAMRDGYKPNPDAGVDLLDIFLQTTTDLYKLGGMVFGFLSAGRKFYVPYKVDMVANGCLHVGDTTTYTISWFMKEIHHRDNQHLGAVNKIRAEAEEVLGSRIYLGYGDTPVRKQPAA
jgi:hypothetical protein